MKNVPVLICLYIFYSRRKGRNVEIMNTSHMVIIFIISPFVLPFLHSVMHQILMEYGKLKINAKIKDWELFPLRSVRNGRLQFL